MSALDLGGDFVNVDGCLIDRKSLEVGEALYAYDENLVVIAIDPDRAEFMEAPYMIAELCPDGKLRKIFDVWELDMSVVERVKQADTHSRDIQAHLDYMIAQQKKEAATRYRELQDEINSIAVGLLKHRKSSFSYKDPKNNDLVTIYEDRPAERKKAND